MYTCTACRTAEIVVDERVVERARVRAWDRAAIACRARARAAARAGHAARPAGARRTSWRRVLRGQ